MDVYVYVCVCVSVSVRVCAERVFSRPATVSSCFVRREVFQIILHGWKHQHS